MTEYWKSLEELNGADSEAGEHDIPSVPHHGTEVLSDDVIKASSSRRDFLKLSGFSIAAATLVSSCEIPVRRAIPFVIKPEEVTPGVANHYASSYVDGSDYCSVLVKTRDGRPIKIEGNELSSITKGGTSARVQASVLSLYDTARLEGPLSHGEKATWAEVDSQVTANLRSISGRDGRIVLLTSTIISPTTKHAIESFVEKYPTTEVVCYDSVSASAMLVANQNCFGQKVIPSYRFDKANVIVGFNADFLGTWLSPIEFTRQYSETRKVGKGKTTMSHHIQLEAGMSLTGSNADQRIPIKPSQEGAILLHLYNEIANAVGAETHLNPESAVDTSSMAKELLANQGRSLLVSGTNDVPIQTIVNAINALLGNYGNTIDLNVPMYVKQGTDEGIAMFMEDMNAGKIDALLLYNVNPVYDYPEADKFKSGLEEVVTLTVSFASRLDETAALTKYVCPDSHYLESWGDAEPKKGFFSLAQPTIPKLFDTRSVSECLLKWAGTEIECHDFLKAYWEKNIFPLQKEITDFHAFWNQSLQNGIFELSTDPSEQPSLNQEAVRLEAPEILQNTIQGEGLELVLYENIGIGNGKQANNPWLQEMPDPISKVCWDNFASVSPKFATDQGLEIGDVIKINDDFSIPVLVQPGQAYGTISIAVGYGRTKAGKVGNGVGKNAFRFAEYRDGSVHYFTKGVTVSKTSETSPFALTQTHHSLEGRPIIRETTLNEYIENPSAGNEMHEEAEEKMVTLYDEGGYAGFHWEMSIDLNSCTGCGNCIIACQAENNVAVIGKEQVRKRRIMHWIRIDRYYSDDEVSPKVLHQPIMCQHCDHAPCENVCPVSATMHSYDGLNQMAYNRCVGTRYCMNNCPYKVRRFNWYEYVDNDKFDFNMNSDLGKMVLNPDVVVRSRGVVEKCSFCIQRIQEKKLDAKLKDRILADGEIQPACMQSCPAKAIIFGDLNNKDSKVAMNYNDERNYNVLEELHVLPSVSYMTKVRNTDVKVGTNEDA